MSERNCITIKGAKTHNLKNVDLILPRDQLIVFTGPSGSGKTSIAFDTLYAEGKRRYMESISVYARQILEVMQKPDVDQIDGLSPAIAIEQKTTTHNPRSTVGTTTDIYDHMRLLWSHVGIPFSPATGLPIQAYTITQMVDRILTLEEGEKIVILAPILVGKKGFYTQELDFYKKRGFVRVQVDGVVYDIDDSRLETMEKENISVVVDRLVIKSDIQQRLAQSLEKALELSLGLVVIDFVESIKEKIVFSTKFSCPVSGFTLEELEPRVFSFNNPHGACPQCNGLGTREHIDKTLIIDEKLTLLKGAILPWGKGGPMPYFWRMLEALSRHYHFPLDVPWHTLPSSIQEVILYGSQDEKITFFSEKDGQGKVAKRPFEGVIPSLERRMYESGMLHEEFRPYTHTALCETCQGQRLRKEILCVKILSCSIADVAHLSIHQALLWFQKLLTASVELGTQRASIMQPIVHEIIQRLRFLEDVGLGYLTLARQTSTLSGGEAQRIQLASQIGAGLMGVLYVLDEPSIGLHQRDNDRLLKTLIKLRDLKNTVIVVEHDEEAIRMADYVVDMGPGAGNYGGYVMAQGTPHEIEQNPNSLTGHYLSGKKFIAVPQKRRGGNASFLTLYGASGNNLKNIDVRIPLGTMTCFTGVSGSGKSTLVIQTLFKILAKNLNGAHTFPQPFKKITGMQMLNKVIDIDQSPIGRTPRSNPATYTGVFSLIRDWYAHLPESKVRGYAEGRFSFNVKGGRCEACQGDGVMKIEMHFLSDIYVTCEVCKGKRYNRETLEIRYKEKSIFDVLDMTVDEAHVFFEAIPGITQKLNVLKRVGLGYIKLGQSSTTLSGGEAQRIKLAKELSRRSTGRTIYILDEPTTGLHFQDIAHLLAVLNEFVDQGNTVLVIEHNLDVIKAADWIIDIGPEGGDGGGEIVAQGTPEEVVDFEQSHTGKFLKHVLERGRVYAAL